MTVVALTGASGFIGSHVAEALLRDGHTVRAVVRDKTNADKCAHLTALGAAHAAAGGGLELFEGDLLVAGSFDAAFAGAEVVVHTAAVVEILRTSDPQATIIDPSVRGVRHLLASLDASPSVRRLVHTSSIVAVYTYDKGDGHVFDEADWNDWSTAENDPYGFAKTEAERLVAAHRGAFDVVRCNPGVTLGPPMTKAHTKASTVLLRQLIYGNAQLNYPSSCVDARATTRPPGMKLSPPLSSLSGSSTCATSRARTRSPRRCRARQSRASGTSSRTPRAASTRSSSPRSRSAASRSTAWTRRPSTRRSRSRSRARSRTCPSSARSP